MRIAAIVDELDTLADQIQASKIAGARDLAREIDIISNSLEAAASGSGRGGSRAATNPLKMEMPRTRDRFNPGSEGADEVSRADTLDVDPNDYHKTPVGPRDVLNVARGYDARTGESRDEGVDSLADLDLDFASHDPVYLQASARRGKRRKFEDLERDEEFKAEDEDEGEDTGFPEDFEEEQFPEGDPNDPWTTAGLPGGTIDRKERDQKGEPVEAYVTRPYKGKKKHAAPSRDDRSNVHVKDAKNLHRDEPGDEVERDHDLGGFGENPDYPERYPKAPRHVKVTTDEEFSYDSAGPEVHDDGIRESLMGEHTYDHLRDGGDEDHRVGSRGRDRQARWNPEDDGGWDALDDEFGGLAETPDYPDGTGGETPQPRQGTIEFASSGRSGSQGRNGSQGHSGSRGRSARSDSRVSTVRVYQPDFVSPYTEPVWRGAVTRVASARRLFRDGRVNYKLIASVYRRALQHYLGQAGGSPPSR
jgi:hypothetical protein